MPNLGKWWIILIGVLVVAALFVAMRFTNVEMQEGGRLLLSSGNDPGER